MILSKENQAEEIIPEMKTKSSRYCMLAIIKIK
jgi:hypothetical protein